MDNTHKNISRYAYEKSGFYGWRVPFIRKNSVFCKYFSDRQYGGEEESFNAAIKLRDAVLAARNQPESSPKAVFEKFSTKKGGNA